MDQCDGVMRIKTANAANILDEIDETALARAMHVYCIKASKNG
jgi:hypothetical protein